jgi:hydroxyacylglutathione hydrolase
MAASLARLAELPAATRVYCAHEYTLANLRFALAVEPGSEALAARQAHAQAQRDRGLPTVPSLIEEELATNPFLRTTVPAVVAAAETFAGRPLADADAVFAALREWKNGFR